MSAGPEGAWDMSVAKRAVAHETIFLNHTVSRLFSADQYLAGLRRKLTDKGILRVGQLIRLTEEELLRNAPRTSPGVLKRVVDCLANVELGLGMSTNGWRNPDLRPSNKPATRAKRTIKRAAHASKRSHVVRRSVRKHDSQP
jgi:hypothetical protein